MKTVVITGASRGIGRAATQKFIEAGWRVIGTSTRGEVPYSAKEFVPVQLELSDTGSISAAVEAIAYAAPAIDALVNNAGIFEEAEWDSTVMDIARLRRLLEVNLIGTIDLTERLLAAVPSIPRVIFLSSRAGALTDQNDGTEPAYRITKTGINMYMRTLAGRLRNTATVSSLDPGWVKTDMGGEEAPRNPHLAAHDIYRLATEQIPSGLFWHGGEPRSW